VKNPIFIRAAGAVLLVTALAKLVSALGEASILSKSDPLFYFISNRQLLFLAAILELLVGIVAWRACDCRVAGGLVAWIATLFAAYRTGLWLVGYHGTCNCLGHTTDALGISPQAADHFMVGILLYLLIVGYVSVFYDSLGRMWALGSGRFFGRADMRRAGPNHPAE
jgi:hypothetical protein